MRIPRLEVLRRLLLGRLFFNLAAVLGVAQALVLHWGAVAIAGAGDAAGGSAPAAAAWLGAGLVLAVGNALGVPPLVRARHRSDRLGTAARLYMELGVATLLVAAAVVASWALYGVAGGAALALGADPSAVHAAFRALSALGVGAVALQIAWGFTVGQARIDVTEMRVPLRRLHPDLAGLRLVQISDLHIGNRLEGRRLERMVERTNATGADVVVLTGDLFDFDPSHVEDGARRLGSLRARYGVYAILGNHDLYVGAERVADALARHAPDIRLLRDELVRLPLPAPLYLAGVEDPGERWWDRGLRIPAIDALAAGRPEDGPVVLLVHQPEAFPHAASHGFPLVLAGHTHGGQIALPVRGGRLNLARVMSRFTRGAYRADPGADAPVLYVNRGLGVGGPSVRIHCNREIAVLELVPAPA